MPLGVMRKHIKYYNFDVNTTLYIYVMIPRFEERPNGITAHSMPLPRRWGSINSKQ